MLPDYRIRVSKRAKYIRLCMQSNGGLEVVLPPGMPAEEAERMVRERLDWIEKQRQKLAERNDSVVDALPDELVFPALNRRVSVQYVPYAGSAWQLKAGVLRVMTSDESAKLPVLRDYLKAQAKKDLPPMLAAVAEEMDESYAALRIKLQKTRWGSCSNRRGINLNARLVLLPAHLIRHVMVHELAHLQHLNHSPAFWRRVAVFNPSYQEDKKELEAWGRRLPRCFQ